MLEMIFRVNSFPHISINSIQQSAFLCYRMLCFNKKKLTTKDTPLENSTVYLLYSSQVEQRSFYWVFYLQTNNRTKKKHKFCHSEVLSFDEFFFLGILSAQPSGIVSFIQTIGMLFFCVCSQNFHWFAVEWYFCIRLKIYLLHVIVSARLSFPKSSTFASWFRRKTAFQLNINVLWMSFSLYSTANRNFRF